MILCVKKCGSDSRDTEMEKMTMHESDDPQQLFDDPTCINQKCAQIGLWKDEKVNGLNGMNHCFVVEL